MFHHMAEAFLDLQVFLPAIGAKMKGYEGAAIQAISFLAVMFFMSRKPLNKFNCPPINEINSRHLLRR